MALVLLLSTSSSSAPAPEASGGTSGCMASSDTWRIPAGAFGHEAGEAWVKSSEGESFVRASGEAWGAAYAASGADPDEARAQAERTIAFFTAV